MLRVLRPISNFGTQREGTGTPFFNHLFGEKYHGNQAIPIFIG